jgi:thiamine-monophosphate kinase
MPIHISEFACHNWLKGVLERSPFDAVGVGDDCAVLDLFPDQFLLLTSDRVPVSAFEYGPNYVGRFCVIHNFSDIICKGGTPLGLLLDTFVPRSFLGGEWEDLIHGAQECAKTFGAHILGGDTKEAASLTIVGCAIGTVPKNRFVRRSGAKPGDICAISLTGGFRFGSAWAHQVYSALDISVSPEYAAILREHFFRDNLRLPFRETLAATSAHGINAGIDTSDGAGAAFHLLAIESKVCLVLDYDALLSCIDKIVLPLSSTLKIDPIKFAFSPGFVWENVFSIDRRAFAEARARVREVGGELYEIGRFEEGTGVRMHMPNGGVVGITPFFNEAFRDDRSQSNSAEAWLSHDIFA